MTTFMHRGSGPLVSILIPSRGRPAGLLRAIDSLWSLAQDKSLIEFLIKVDDDDTETTEALKELTARCPFLNGKVIISPRGQGYQDLHRYVNELCAHATGDWLFLVNDDCTMETGSWDQIILRTIFLRPWFAAWDIALLTCRTINSDATQFLLLRRKVYEILGHWSMSPHNDTWILQVMNFLRMAWPITTIHIHHEKSSRDGDWSKKNLILRRHFDSEPTIHSLGAKRLAAADVSKMLDYLDEMQRKAVWVSKPDRPGWYYWDTNNAEGNVVFMDVSGNTFTFVADENCKASAVEPIEIREGRLTFINPAV